MKGSPLLLSAFVFVGAVLLGILVWLATLPSSSEAWSGGREPEITTVTPATLRMDASLPARIEIFLEGKSLFFGRLEDVEHSLDFELPLEGADLVVSASADTAKKIAVRVRAESRGFLCAESTFWGVGDVEGVLPVPGEGQGHE